MQHNAVCYCHVSLINGTVDKNMYNILMSKIRNVFCFAFRPMAYCGSVGLVVISFACFLVFCAPTFIT